MSDLALLADVGGTNARFAIARGDAIEAEARLKVADYPDLTEALRDFFTGIPPAALPRRAALALAGPVCGETVRLTNSLWTVTAGEVKRAFGFRDVLLVNDFAAVAWAVPELGEEDLRQIGGGRPVRDAPAAVIGPGTGLGVAGLVPGPAGPVVLVTEGGHATMPATDEHEARILERLRRRFGHVSAERVLSGEGLLNLHEVLAELAGVAPLARTPEDITRRALAGDCPSSDGALAAFCAMLGTVAGNVALTLGARRGVYIAGGILPGIGDYLAASAFRERFEDKGRFRAYLAAIPTWLITHPDPAFLGLQSLLRQRPTIAG